MIRTIKSFARPCPKILTSIVILMGSYVTVAQQPQLDSLVRKFVDYRTNNLQEKLYVHTDQEVYLTGETLWLKIFSVDGHLHRPLEVSKVAYLEIIDEVNHPVLQAKLSLINGSGNGSFFLPATLASGNYTLRAYTHWMKNFGPEFYFHKTISIVNAFQKPDKPKTTALTFEAQFFPEGGNLIGGLENKIAFQVTDASGAGIDFNGFLFNEKNDTVAWFQPLKFGIGSFTFTPETGKLYRALISDSKGKRNSFNLPMASGRGCTLHLEEDQNEITIIIRHSDESFKPAYIFVHARQRVTLAKKLEPERNETIIKIQKSILLDGISHITLFNETLQPVCERLYYNGNGPDLVIESGALETSYGVRRKVTLDLTTHSKKEGLVASNLMVTVTKRDSLSREQGSLPAYLWLTSDLKGRVESPEYYLNPKDPNVKEAIDNLMLTHGWRRFKWVDVVSGIEANRPFVPEYRGHIILGKVKTPGGLPAAGVETFVSVPGKNIQLRTSRSNAMGEVQYEMPDFYGRNKIIAQTNKGMDSVSIIQITSPFSDRVHTQKISPLYLSPGLEKQLLNRSVAMQVQDIFYKERNEKVFNPRIDSTAFYGKPDEEYFLDQYTRFPVMEEVMREYVKGVFVRQKKGQFHFMVLDRVNKNLLREDPLILVDGLPVFEVNRIIHFDPLLVKKLELITRKYYMGYATFPGIASYRTYSGDLAGFKPDPGSMVLDYEGMQLQREFYSPVYENDSQRTSRLPDRRNLLYWAPNLYTGIDGKLRVEFYTSDVRGEYTATIEGITGEGAAGRHTVSFRVK